MVISPALDQLHVMRLTECSGKHLPHIITTDGQFNEDALHPIRKRTCVTPAVIVNRSTAKIMSQLVSYSESADVSR